MFYVYLLIDTWLKEPFYIGMTEDLEKRFYGHCNPSEKAKNHDYYRRVACLQYLKMKPYMMLLDKCETKEAALEAETFWIDHFIALGHPICNKRHSGQNKSPLRTMKIISMSEENLAIFKQKKSGGNIASLAKRLNISSETLRIALKKNRINYRYWREIKFYYNLKDQNEAGEGYTIIKSREPEV